MFKILGNTGDSGADLLPIYWFCHAGSGPASLMRSARELPACWRLHAATLPGREDRFSEGLIFSLSEIVDQFYDELRQRIAGPYALVGHSFGSLLCYLLAERLTQDNLAPAALTVMTLASPDRLNQVPAVATAPDDQFLDYLDRRFGGVPEALRANPEALHLFLPIVRYDMRMLESYVHQPSPPLPIPITVIGGTDDNAVSRADLSGWRSFTNSTFSMRIMPGDHFFPIQSVKAIMELTSRASIA